MNERGFYLPIIFVAFSVLRGRFVDPIPFVWIEGFIYASC